MSAQRNIPLFIAFRVFFNARWYYPVMAILFLDFGVTLKQFALLNVVWAVSIVCLEVPSGALADQIGRRRMLILAALLMVGEMALLAFAPLGSAWLFPMFVMNRIFSGAAEACASGADESLAYDSLKAVGQEAQWPGVLARMMRWQSAGFLIAMVLGAAVYDPALVQRALSWVGIEAHLTRADTLRWPIYLTLGNAAVVLFATLRMEEPASEAPPRKLSFGATLAQTLAAGGWILRTPLVLFVILAGLGMDSVIRLFMTVGSNYYRLIELPEASFGIIGSCMGLFGLFVPRLAQWLSENRSMTANFATAGALGLGALIGSAFFWKHWGVLTMIPLGVGMTLLGFFLSHYLNTLITDSSLRATVLSFKGLSFNLAYGAAGLLFAAYTSRAAAGAAEQDAIFIQAIGWLPWCFGAILAVVALAGLKLHAAHRAQTVWAAGDVEV